MKRGPLNRALWSFLGQGLSSVSNVVLTLLVLSTSSVREFAAFSLCITTYLFLVELTRALVSVPITILYAGERGGRAETKRSALGLVVVTALAFSLLLGAGSAVAGARPVFLVLAAFLPVLLLEDALRYVAFSEFRPAVAAAADGSWVLLQVAGSAAAFLSGHATVVSLVCIWGVGGIVGAGLLSAKLRIAPRLVGSGSWWRQHRVLSRRLTVEFLSTSGCSYALFYGLAVVAGPPEFGRFKAAQILLGPVTTLLLGGLALSVPESVRARADSMRLRAFAARLSLFLFAAALVWGLVVFLLLPSIGPRLFPDHWSLARPLVPLLALYAAAIGAWTGPISGVRALDDTAWIVRARGVTGGSVLVAGLLVSSLIGAAGAALCMIVGEWMLAGVAWGRFRSRLRSIAPAPGPATG